MAKIALFSSVPYFCVSGTFFTSAFSQYSIRILEIFGFSALDCSLHRGRFLL
jgi:hypothetical protein